MLAQSSTLRIYPKNETLSGYTNGIFKLCNKKGNLVMGLVMLDSGDRIFDETVAVWGMIIFVMTRWSGMQSRLDCCRDSMEQMQKR